MCLLRSSSAGRNALLFHYNAQSRSGERASNRSTQTTSAQGFHLAFTELAFGATVDMEPGMAVETQMEWTMKIVSSLATTALLALAVPALAQTSTAPKSGTTKMSQAECTAAWSKLDTAKSGSVSQSQAQGVVKDFKAADTNNDGKLSQAEFMAACDKGLVTASATGSGGRGLTGTESGSSTTPGASTAPGGSTAPKK